MIGSLRTMTTAAAIGFCGLGATNPSFAQTACEVQKLRPTQPAPGDEFGRSVAISADVTLVGAPNDDDNGFNAGAAYVFRFDGSSWGQEQKLDAVGGGAVDDHFGQSVAISGDIALIGANTDDFGIDSGSVYVFRLGGLLWAQEQHMLPDDGSAGDEFSQSVAISGEVAVIGALGHQHKGAGSGSAYVFRYNPKIGVWIQQQELLASDGAVGDLFGQSVAIEGDVAVIGAPMGAGNVANTGTAYVFRFDGLDWVQEQKLVPSDSEPGDQFGHSVTVSGDIAVVGASQDDDNGLNSGSAYVFRFDSSAWRLQQKLLASDGDVGDDFGSSVGLSGEAVVVGAHDHDHNGSDAGSAYLFRYDPDTSQWPEVQELLASDGIQNDLFGWSLAMDGDTAVIGAWGDDDNGPDSGSAYMFAGLSGLDCNLNGVSDVCDIADGTSKDTDGNGIPDECERQACSWDLDATGSVGILDLLALLAAWGSDPGGPPDFDGD
ncbi:MAG: FG-GAP repeat protein, partial [Acidimicrobiia bacterium]